VKLSNKKRITVLILIFTVLPIITALFCVPEAKAVSNGGEEKSSGGYSPYVYRFDTHYGTHDWIADSALRLINMSDNLQYRKSIQWLFDTDLPLKDYDSYLTLGMGSNYRPWYFSTDRDGGQWDANDPEARRTWMVSRRYGNFLHGTLYPDISQAHINIKDEDGVPRAEVKNFDITTGWGNFPHSVIWYWKDDLEIFRMDDPTGALKCQRAANDAIRLAGGNNPEERRWYEAGARCLGGMTHYIADLSSFAHVYKDYNWNPYDFGISDCGHFLDEYTMYNLLTYFTTSDIFPNGGPDWSLVNCSNLRVENPITHKIGDLITVKDGKGTTDKLTHLISPELAAIEMSSLTYSGVDPENRLKDAQGQYIPLPNSQNILGYVGGDMPYSGSRGEDDLGPNSPRWLPITSGAFKDDPDYSQRHRWSMSANDRHYDGYGAACYAAYNRTIVLLNWAVYYTACAILWACMRINAPDDSTDASRIGTYQGPTDLGTQPLSQKELLQYWEGNYASKLAGIGSREYDVDTVIAGVMTSLIIVLPIIVLAIMPGAVSDVKNKIKELKAQSVTDAEIRQINEIAAITNGQTPFP
jgi:hypothetical protein